MKTLRSLITLNAVFFLIAGFLVTVPFPYSVPLYLYKLSAREIDVLRFLGVVLAAFGGVLLTLRGLTLPKERRRLALGLSIADALIMIMTAFLVTALWKSSFGWLFTLPCLLLAAALAWEALQPESPAAAAEALPIPDEIRRIWLRQIGEAAAQEERNRLARDLHDSIKQQIFSINVSTAAAQERWERDPRGARAALADVRRSAREAMVEMQALLHQLRPQALSSTAGLVEALREQCEALGYRTGAEVSLEPGEAIPDERLPPGAQETFFRIAQEALANVARHARAHKVRVQLGREGDWALLRVADDGQGFDAAAATSGMGVRNLRERAESLRGMVEIRSVPGSGTVITFGIPLTLPPAPVRAQSPVERALDQEKHPSLLLFLAMGLFVLIQPTPDSYYYETVRGTLNTFFLLGIAVESQQRVRSALDSFPSAVPEVVSRLRYLSHRNCVLYFFAAAAWWVTWYWRLDKIWIGWTIIWLAVALFCGRLTAVELVRFHRASEPRRRWPRFLLRPVGEEWLVLSFALLTWIAFMMILLVLVPSIWPRLFRLLLPTWPTKIFFLLCGAVVLAYFIARQPRTGGATA